jgi:predicted RNA-binding protein with PIN domain
MTTSGKAHPHSGRDSPPPPEEADPQRFRWIIDGHNAIFADPELEALQIEGQRREARRGLEERLEAFGRAIGSRIWIVYDGNRMPRNPDAVDYPHLWTVYSDAPSEEADDRIVFLARQALSEGTPPLVVSSDRRTLASRLPQGARHLEAQDFFRRVVRKRLRRPEKSQAGEMEDVERFFLSRSPFEEDRALVDGPPVPPPDPESGASNQGP